jgi:hypothetical protein
MCRGRKSETARRKKEKDAARKKTEMLDAAHKKD